MSLEAWVAFCITEAVLCFTPGPAVLLIVSVAARRGMRQSFGATLGVLAANSLYFALSATGVAAVLVASREVFLALKWAGAAYLIWLGLGLLLARESRVASEPGAALGGSFLRGLLVQGANPKALAFFVALLPQFIDPRQPVAFQLLVLGSSSVAIELFALTTYGLGAVRAGRAAGARLARGLERVGGGLLVAAGARLATARHE